MPACAADPYSHPVALNAARVYKPSWDLGRDERSSPFRQFFRKVGRAPTLAEKFALARNGLELRELRDGHAYLRERGGPTLTAEEEEVYAVREGVLLEAGYW